MKKTLKGYLAGFVSALLVTSLSLTAFAAIRRNIEVTYSDIKVNVNGQNVILKDAAGNIIEPFAYNGATYLPVRAVADALSCNVDWVQASQTVMITNGGGSTTSGGGSTSGTNGIENKLIDTVKPYSVAGGKTAYYASNSSKGITMGGTEYKNSIVFGNSLGNSGVCSASFNLGGKYTTLSAFGGVIDGRGGSAVFTIYGDGNMLKTFEVTSGQLPINFSVDVTGVSNLVIECNVSSMNNSGLGDIIVK